MSLVTAIGQSERFTGRVTSVIDGDTIGVMREGREVRIRLDGIDAPEGGQEFGQRAKQFASEIAFGKTVDVIVRDVDRYGRLVARVMAGGEDLSVALVEAGLAWHFLRYSNDPILQAAETRARAQRVGLWTEVNPAPAWTYRRGGQPAVSQVAAVGGLFGNTRSMVVHAGNCSALKTCKYCTQRFDSLADAVAGGYHPHRGSSGCIRD